MPPNGLSVQTENSFVELSELPTTNTYQTCSSVYKSHEAKQCTLTQQSEEKVKGSSIPASSHIHQLCTIWTETKGAKRITVHLRCVLLCGSALRGGMGGGWWVVGGGGGSAPALC